MPGSRHLPLRVQWTLSNPLTIGPAGIHLDGLLGKLVFERSGVLDDVCVDDDASVRDVFDELMRTRGLPLARTPLDDAGRWVYKASLLLYEHQGVQQVLWSSPAMTAGVARGNLHGLVERPHVAAAALNRGVFRPMVGHVQAKFAPRVVAYCVGDPVELVELLSPLASIGSRTARGMGCLDAGGFSLVEDPLAEHAWMLRAMPHEPMPGYRPDRGRLQGPYWRRDGITSVWQPIDPLEVLAAMARQHGLPEPEMGARADQVARS